MSRSEPDKDVPGNAVDDAVFAVAVDNVDVDVVVKAPPLLPPPLFLLLAPWLSAELSSSIRAASWPRSEAILLWWVVVAGEGKGFNEREVSEGAGSKEGEGRWLIFFFVRRWS